MIKSGRILQLISTRSLFVREHDFEYINLKEVEDNPIIGKVVFSLKNGNESNILNLYLLSYQIVE